MTNDKNIQNYYKNNVDLLNDDFNSFLQQVGKTYLGETISHKVFTTLIDSIITTLNINKKDILMDLGCANGLITNEISNYSSFIYGFDLSEELITVAKQNHQHENITYKISNILDVNFQKYDISKIYMYEVLQHLEYKMLRELLKKMALELNEFSFMIGSIPDQEKILNFYHTAERKKYLFEELLENNQSHLGNWWYKEHLLSICNDLNLEISFIEQNNILHTSHYRFDVLIKKLSS